MKKDIQESKKIINKKEAKGITLIALVITIIVLLILAGISLATLSGNNSIIEQSQNAKEKTINAQNDEDSTIQEYQDELANQIQENFGDGSTSDETYRLVGNGEKYGMNSYKFWIDNSLGEYIPMQEEFEPKMTIEGESNVIDLSEYIQRDPYINNNINTICIVLGVDFESYDGKNATITLNMNGKQLTWRGKIEHSPK